MGAQGRAVQPLSLRSPTTTTSFTPFAMNSWLSWAMMSVATEFGFLR
jgi:hypothetical protein